MHRALALASFLFVGTGVVVACGGAQDTDLFAAGDGGSSGSSPGEDGSVTPDPEDGGVVEDDATPGPTDAGPRTDATADSGPLPQDAGPKTCRMAPAANDCPANEYCRASACGASLGTCVKIPAPSNRYEPVCGCDNVTYWNESLLSEARASIKSAGVCPGPVTCGALKACPTGTFCNREVQSQAYCAVGLEGTCWGMPANCPGSGSGRAHICGQGKGSCKSLCEAIRGQIAWYDDNSCN